MEIFKSYDNICPVFLFFTFGCAVSFHIKSTKLNKWGKKKKCRQKPSLQKAIFR